MMSWPKTASNSLENDDERREEIFFYPPKKDDEDDDDADAPNWFRLDKHNQYTMSVVTV